MSTGLLILALLIAVVSVPTVAGMTAWGLAGGDGEPGSAGSLRHVRALDDVQLDHVCRSPLVLSTRAAEPHAAGPGGRLPGCIISPGCSQRQGPGIPVVGIWHSGGARLAEGVRSLHAVGQIFHVMTRASGRVPQVSVVLGPAAMLLWLALTVLRGRRDSFAFGALATGLATVALLFVINPDAVVARANVARMALVDAPARFDVAYATSLSAGAVPVLIDALSAVPSDVQCPLARHMLRRWPPNHNRAIRSWNWSAVRASAAVREHEARLRSMVGPDLKCAARP